jgi:hypothetical protein
MSMRCAGISAIYLAVLGRARVSIFDRIPERLMTAFADAFHLGTVFTLIAGCRLPQRMRCPRRSNNSRAGGPFAFWGQRLALCTGCLSPCNSVLDANLVTNALSRKVEKRRCGKKLATIRQSDAFGTHFVLPVLG